VSSVNIYSTTKILVIAGQVLSKMLLWETNGFFHNILEVFLLMTMYSQRIVFAYVSTQQHSRWSVSQESAWFSAEEAYEAVISKARCSGRIFMMHICQKACARKRRWLAHFFTVATTWEHNLLIIVDGLCGVVRNFFVQFCDQNNGALKKKRWLMKWHMTNGIRRFSSGLLVSRYSHGSRS